MSAETLTNLATEYSSNLQFIESQEAMELGKELEVEAKKAEQRIKDELNTRPEEEKAVGVDAQFLVSLQSVDTNYFPAIQGQYDYDTLYDYDSLIGRYHDQQLKIGIN